MKSSWFSVEGTPYPLGAKWIEDDRAFNFALYSKHATSVRLLLFSRDRLNKPIIELELDYLRNKSGRIWHCRVPESDLSGVWYYAYQIDGPSRGQGYDLHAFDREKLLLDPYAKEIYFPESFDRLAAMRPGSNMGRAPLGVLCHDTGLSRRSVHSARFHEHDLVIYELHVRGFTRDPGSGVAPNRRGTYLGVIDRIPYLQKLGVTAVELLPIHQFDPQEGNYWGYMPLNFFAPHEQYASGTQTAPEEFRMMVDALHAADIEVLLDVVFNHTVEGDQSGPCYSLKGIDNSSYYMTTGDPEHPYQNYSGTGNTLHTKNRHVCRMILDSMRHWVEEYHVDGFRFDLASIFNRRADGTVSSDQSRLVGAMRADPVLGSVRLIAEPWDAGGLDQLGRDFPGKRWFQWNGRFRDDMRRFVKGDPGLVAAAMQRLYGSDDLFPDSLMEACHPFQSINYINSHDGFTLYDLVSWNVRHNWANGEQNRDGHPSNYSWNCGWEGDKDVPPAVLKLRLRQARNFCCLLLLSNGTPMFRAGDEFLHTQNGNNNPWNQDNEISWLNWSRLEDHQPFFRFFQMMIAFRKAHPTIARCRFWREDVRWYGTGPHTDWSPASHCLAYFLDGRSQNDDDLYVMINFGVSTQVFEVQEFTGRTWKKVIDTGQDSPHDFQAPGRELPVTSAHQTVGGRSIIVLRSPRENAQ